MVAFASTSSGAARAKALGFAASVAMAAYAAYPATAIAKEPIAPACLSAGSELAQLRCSTALSKKATEGYEARSRAALVRGAAADAQTVAADKRSAAADARSAAADKSIDKSKRIIETASTAKSCYDGVLQEVMAAKKIAPLTPDQKNAFKVRAAECEKS